MIGNKKGWLISAAIAGAALLISLMIILQSAFSSGSRATTKTLRAGVLDKWTTAEPISGFISDPPLGTDNAGDDYARAVRLIRDNEEVIRRFHGSYRTWQTNAQEATYETRGMPREDTLARIREIPFDVPPQVEEMLRHVAQAVTQEKMEYVFVHTSPKLYVDRRIEASYDLIAVAKVLMDVSAYHYYRDDFEQSLTPREHLLVLGWHMFNERAHVDMMYQGLIIQLDALEMLITAYEELGHADKADRARNYRASVKDLMDRMAEKLDAIMPPADEDRLAEPGDVFNVARNDQDRAWRVQAVLALGILKVQPQGVIARADERVTRKLIREFEKSSDPMIRAAAVAARDLTLARDEEPTPPEETEDSD